MLPRAVLVERPTEYQELLARHGTREQARFFLEQRGLDITGAAARHIAQEHARAQVLAGIPAEWRVARVDRGDLDRFLFSDGDVVFVLGQDGLVANTAKYLHGQPVIGLNPEPRRNAGVLVPHAPCATADLCADLVAGRERTEERAMVRASLDDGQELVALNEVFVGHASHQSARYVLDAGGLRERQSSSGVIVATGTGATGWASSINRGLRQPMSLPAPTDPALAWFVREAWESPGSQATMTAGLVAPTDEITLTGEFGEGGGAVFGDGIETDRLTVDWGQRVQIGVAPVRLRLVQ